MEKKGFHAMSDLKAFYFAESLDYISSGIDQRKGHHIFLTYEDKEEGLGFFPPLMSFL